MLWGTLLVSEARGRSLMGWKGWMVVVMMKGLVGRGRGVAVVVIWWVVGGLLLHIGVWRLLTHYDIIFIPIS